MQGIENRWEAKTDNLQETLSKEIQNLRLKQAEMKNTIAEIKKFTSKEIVTECRRQKNE